VLAGLIEGRQVRLSEVIEMLQRTVRQHRLAGTQRIDHGVAWFMKPP
jgi:hypothetical protein